MTRIFEEKQTLFFLPLHLDREDRIDGGEEQEEEGGSDAIPHFIEMV